MRNETQKRVIFCARRLRIIRENCKSRVNSNPIKIIQYIFNISKTIKIMRSHVSKSLFLSLLFIFERKKKKTINVSRKPRTPIITVEFMIGKGHILGSTMIFSPSHGFVMKCDPSGSTERSSASTLGIYLGRRRWCNNDMCEELRAQNAKRALALSFSLSLSRLFLSFILTFEKKKKYPRERSCPRVIMALYREAAPAPLSRHDCVTILWYFDIFGLLFKRRSR